VTGAGRGIGRAIALALSEAGFSVIVNDLPGSADIEETVTAIREKGGDAKAASLDISRVEAFEQFVEDAWVARRMIGAKSHRFRSIVTISSINSEFASIDRGEYCISKTGLSMMARLFAIRLADHGIRSYEIRPGIIRTQMTAVARDKYDRLIDEGLTPIKRWGEPEDIGRAVAMLATGQLGYSTGEVVHVDGGLALGRI
jgi:NAD(P)-dependent dehydrogenase (short-subunit alcohol dehydrogenase family)